MIILLVYATYSEGFRPSGINRTTGRTAELVPDTYTSDLLEKFEFGWKSSLADGKVTFNGLMYSYEVGRLSIYKICI